jgi:uncharacterized membrane protein YfcA
MLTEFLATLVSFFASLLGSFAGGGGSLIRIPLLIWILPGGYLPAFILSKFSSAAMTFTSGVIHWRKNDLSAKLFWVLTAFGLLGTAVGTYILQFHLNEDLFEMILGLLLVSMAIYLICKKDLGLIEHDHRKYLTPKRLIQTAIFAFLVNIIGGVFGGTGVVVTLYLVLYLKMPFIRAVAYTMSTYFIINLAQSLYLLSVIEVEFHMILLVMFGGMLGAYFGTHLQYLKGNKWVKVASIVLMMVIGLKSLFF